MAEEVDRGLTFKKFSSIKRLSNIVKSVEEFKAGDNDYRNYAIALTKPIHYRGKVKLHGMNGGITIQSGKIRAQSRTQFIGNSHLGEIAHKHRDYFLSLYNSKPGYEIITIYGEWCGPGVQNSHNLALSKLKQTIFAVFAVQFDDGVIFHPEEIEMFLTINGAEKIPDRIYVLPWQTEIIELDFMNINENNVQFINDQVENVDSQDPWVFNTFNVNGHGEGMVLYPVNISEQQLLTRNMFTSFIFKAKGKKHQVVGTKQSAQIKPEAVASAQEYVKLFVTPGRLDQALQEIGGKVSKQNIPSFISWMIEDIKKEGLDELEASGLTWKQVAPLIVNEAKSWYLQQLK